MSVLAFDPIATASQIGLIMLSLALLLAGYRLFRGPTLFDRILGLETVGIVLVALFALKAITADSAELIRVATVAALINFLGTVAFATYVRRSLIRD